MKRWYRSLYQPGTGLGENGQRITACQEHIELSKEAAKEGMVLLKNESQILPLKKGSRIALFGKGMFDYVKGGGGSGDVTVAYVRNLYQGLKLQEDIEIYEETAAYYEAYVKEQYAQGKEPGLLREPELSEKMAGRAARFAKTAVIAISRFSGEGWDRKARQGEKIELQGEGADMIKKSEAVFDRGDFYLTGAEEKMVQTVRRFFDRIVVVLNVGGVVDTHWFHDDPKIQGVLMAWQGGMEGGLAAAELLVGKGNPSGKLSDTFAMELTDYPSTQQFHESQNFVNYLEDIYVGYRYFETIPGKQERVVYPFGYGLSYTTFAMERVSCEVTEDDVVTVRAEVVNTGNMAGREVVQVYFSAPQGKLGKSARSLIGYRKTRLLGPGESQRIYISFSVNEMSSYDDLGKVQKAAWVLEKGEYRFYIGSNVRELEQAGAWKLKEDRITCQMQTRMAPTSLPKRLLADGSYEDLPQGEPNDPDENIFPLLPRGSDNYRFPAQPEIPAHSGAFAGEPSLFDAVADGMITLDEFASELPDEALARLVGGQPNLGVANTFGMGNLPEYGVPNVMTADGPAGLRIRPECGVVTTAWPCATLLSCTWDPDLVEAVGRAGGKEVKENNISIWLTPAVNIHRSPLCGRNFEYYSEDPYLAGKQAAAMVRGIQSNHVAASVKHFALNNKETNRKNSDSRASERAIREIYLKAFEIIVKEAKPWTIMSSYNIINGHRASENADLLTGILRDEWGYEGMVTTDWWTYGEHYKEVKAGNDLKMACGYPERLLKAMKEGALTRQELEQCAKRILGTILKLQ